MVLQKIVLQTNDFLKAAPLRRWTLKWLIMIGHPTSYMPRIDELLGDLRELRLMRKRVRKKEVRSKLPKRSLLFLLSYSWHLHQFGKHTLRLVRRSLHWQSYFYRGAIRASLWFIVDLRKEPRLSLAEMLKEHCWSMASLEKLFSASFSSVLSLLSTLVVFFMWKNGWSRNGSLRVTWWFWCIYFIFSVRSLILDS